MRLRHKKWAEPLIEANRDIALLDEDIFSLPDFNELELGSGCGDFLIQKAKANKDINYLGVEINNIAFAISIKKLVNEEDRPSNVHFINTDAHKLLANLKEESIDVIYLNFNDPWPKKKHHKRRLTYVTMLEIYYKLLKKGGKVLYKTDNDVLYEDSKEYFKEFKKFNYTFIDDYKELEAGDVMSEYEKKFRSVNKDIHRIIAITE